MLYVANVYRPSHTRFVLIYSLGRQGLWTRPIRSRLLVFDLWKIRCDLRITDLYDPSDFLIDE